MLDGQVIYVNVVALRAAISFGDFLEIGDPHVRLQEVLQDVMEDVDGIAVEVGIHVKKRFEGGRSIP
jgi:uncharacterized SAM-dependent methyltransferase